MHCSCADGYGRSGSGCAACQGTTNAKKVNAGLAYFGSIVLDLFVISVTLILRKYVARREAAADKEASEASNKADIAAGAAALALNGSDSAALATLSLGNRVSSTRCTGPGGNPGSPDSSSAASPTDSSPTGTRPVPSSPSSSSPRLQQQTTPFRSSSFSLFTPDVVKAGDSGEWRQSRKRAPAAHSIQGVVCFQSPKPRGPHAGRMELQTRPCRDVPSGQSTPAGHEGL